MKKGAYHHLNLTHLEAALPHVLEVARREQWTYETLLERALAAEIDGPFNSRFFHELALQAGWCA